MATVCVVKAQHHIYSYYKQIHTYLYTRECDNMREREREGKREVLLLFCCGSKTQVTSD
jgi:hypothetical protein